jgi:hypothetical protein
MGKSENFLDGYIDVAERIREFKSKFPEGSLRQVSLEFVNVGGKDFVIYTAAAHRGPDDQLPGMGTAWEPVPGSTPYTRGSEVMVAETSAWGRAMIASLAVESQRIASKQEVVNRQAPKRDFLAEAATVGTVSGLRELWQEARTLGVDEKTLIEIAKIKDAIKD